MRKSIGTLLSTVALAGCGAGSDVVEAPPREFAPLRIEAAPDADAISGGGITLFVGSRAEVIVSSPEDDVTVSWWVEVAPGFALDEDTWVTPQLGTARGRPAFVRAFSARRPLQFTVAARASDALGASGPEHRATFCLRD